MSMYMRCDGERVKKGIKAKGKHIMDVSFELGRSHSYLSNCLSNGYLPDKELRYICAKYGIPYHEVKRGYEYGNVTKYVSERTRDKVRREAREQAEAEVNARPEAEVAETITTDAKIELILKNMQTLNEMMGEIIRRLERAK